MIDLPGYEFAPIIKGGELVGVTARAGRLVHAFQWSFLTRWVWDYAHWRLRVLGDRRLWLLLWRVCGWLG